MPRIPVRYGKYRVRGGEPWRIDRDLYEQDFEVMAPNRKRAEQYFRRHYPKAKLYGVDDVYGPHLPSEERMMNPDRYDELMQRRLDYERARVRDLYDRWGFYSKPGMSAEDVDRELEYVANRNFRNAVDYIQNDAPIYRRHEYRYYPEQNDNVENFYEFSPSGVKDRLQMRGILDVPLDRIEDGTPALPRR